MPYVYALCVCPMCMPYVYALYALHALYVCLICLICMPYMPYMHYMYASYALHDDVTPCAHASTDPSLCMWPPTLICMPYMSCMYALYVCVTPPTAQPLRIRNTRSTLFATLVHL